MRCKNAKILISAALDGELSEREQRILEEHLARCADCAAERTSSANLRDVMAAWADDEPSDWLAQSFAYKLQDEMARAGKPVRRPVRAIGAAVAGLATALVAFGIIMHSQLVPDQTVAPKPHPRIETAAPDSAPSDVTASSEAATPDTPSITTPPKPKRASVKPKVYRQARTTSPRQRAPVLASRGADQSDAEIKRKVMRHIMLASATEGDAESAVADRISRADMAMNGSIEELRGVLRKAVDVLATSDAGTY
ncbi:MAG: zf-HC2 domain-containing protein [Armatimonadetes bacterium]|nr:zf-HC2 domain-containing protein [Armatimonadota bacterium]